MLGVTAEPPDIPRVRVLLRGYSWVMIVAAPLAGRLGGAAALAASGASQACRAGSRGPGASRGPPPIWPSTREPRLRRVFGVLAPVLRPGRPDPEAVSGGRVRLVLDMDAAHVAGSD